MTRLAKPEKKAGKGTTNGAECTPTAKSRQLGDGPLATRIEPCIRDTYKSSSSSVSERIVYVGGAICCGHSLP